MQFLRNSCVAVLSFGLIAAILWGSYLDQRVQALTKTNTELQEILEEWQGQTCELEVNRLKRLPPPPYSGLASDDSRFNIKEPLKVSMPTPGQQSGPGANPQ